MTYPKGDAGAIESPPRPVRGIAKNHGDSVRAGFYAAKRCHGVPYDVRDRRITERDGISHRRKIAIEEDMEVIAGSRRPTDHAPDDGHVVPRLNDSASRFHDLDAGRRPASDDEATE